MIIIAQYLQIRPEYWMIELEPLFAGEYSIIRIAPSDTLVESHDCQGTGRKHALTLPLTVAALNSKFPSDLCRF
jgi:hypothetical protein